MSWIGGATSALAALAAAAFFALPAAAQTYDPLSARDVSRMIERDGLDAEIEEGDDGEGEVVISEIDGAGFRVHFKACDEDGEDCELIVFDAGFSFDDGNEHLDADKMNEWNAVNWGKAHLDDEGDPWLSLEVNIVGGITKANLADTFKWWKMMLEDYVEFIDWQPL